MHAQTFKNDHIKAHEPAHAFEFTVNH